MKFDLTPQEALVELQRRIVEMDTRDVTHFIVWYVGDLVDQGRTSTLEEFIQLIDPQICELAPITYILRSSYVVGHTLPSWLHLLNSVREVHKDNPRINRILVGLDKPYKSSFY